MASATETRTPQELGKFFDQYPHAPARGDYKMFTYDGANYYAKNVYDLYAYIMLEKGTAMEFMLENDEPGEFIDKDAVAGMPESQKTKLQSLYNLYCSDGEPYKTLFFNECIRYQFIWLRRNDEFTFGHSDVQGDYARKMFEKNSEVKEVTEFASSCAVPSYQEKEEDVMKYIIKPIIKVMFKD